MIYKVEQTRRFAKQYKKLHDNIVIDVDDAVEVIAEKPSIGDLKKVIWLACVSIKIS